MPTSKDNPPFVFYFFRGIGIVGLIPFIVFTIDTLLTPAYPHPIFNNVAVRLVQALMAAPMSAVLGFLCVRRAPKNVVGWLVITLAYGLSADALRADFGSPLFRAALGSVGVTYFWFTNLLLPSYFPNGRLFPPRFEKWGNRIIGFASVFNLIQLFTAPKFEVFLNNPLATGRYSAANPLYIPILAPVDNVAAILFICLALYSIGSSFFRYLAADPQTRLQIRWLLSAYAFLFSIGFIPIAEIGFVTTICFGFVAPLAITFAILRHRLYDIDIIIRRTLIYSILSAILGAVFFGGVTLTQAILRTATGQTSDLAIVLSTLGIAALFTPLRRRVQAEIDRRFYRTKYDAQKTLEEFGAVMRDEVDAEKLKAALVATIQETMQPKQIALWIRETYHDQ